MLFFCAIHYASKAMGKVCFPWLFCVYVLKEEVYMVICSVNKLSKMYGGNLLFDNISFDIQERDRVGLVGRNGSGKTTLLKLLAGNETPDSGLIHWKKAFPSVILHKFRTITTNCPLGKY